jgi:simple sugar transport system permease protein
VNELIASTLRLATPLLFAGMGGLLCERSGIATICLEGVMLCGAWAAATATYFWHDPWMGVLAGMIAGMLAMGLHAFLSITAKADHIISGVAVNIIAAGLTPVLDKTFFGSPTNSAALPLAERLHPVPIPALCDLPYVGFLFDQPVLIYLAFVLPFGIAYFLYRTPWGLRLRAAGDGPHALRTAGISPARVRWIALLAGGAIASLGGSFLSISHASQFTRDMTAGRGYIALTALIFGKWKPLPTWLACLFFGFFDASQIRIQSHTLFGLSIPVEFVQALPYLVALVVLAGFIGKSRPPLAIGGEAVEA